VTKGAARIYRQIQENKKIDPILLGNIERTRRDWSHVKDFVDGIWLMMNQEKYREDMKNLLFNNSAGQQEFYAQNIKNYLLSSNKTHSIKDLVSIVFKSVTSECQWIGSGENTKLVDRNGTVLVAVDKKFYRPSEVEPPTDNSIPIRKELGWQPKYTFEELMREMIEFDIAEEMKAK
jgi:GDPmannose 4,6-dehydratase